MSTQQSSNEPVRKQFSKERLIQTAESFLQINLGAVPDMSPEDKRAYYETAGILLFFINFAWDVASE